MAAASPAADLEGLARALPKVELHLHLEGTLEPELMFEIARRNGVALPYGDVDEVRAAYRFTDLQSFLDIYYAACEVLRTEQDFHDLTVAYLHRVAADNARHVEVFFDPQTHTGRGVAFGTVVTGISTGLAEGFARHGITSRLFMAFLRHLPAGEAMDTLEAALPYRDLIAGVGLDSGERGNPPSRFTAVFERAGALGWARVAHAGEEGPPEYIREALDLLHVARIDHGNACVGDDTLVERLAGEGIPLTMCPLSNERLHVVDRLEEVPVRALLQRGVHVTVNSDDPAYFGGYLGDNWQACVQRLGLSAGELVTLARNSITASLLSPAEQRAHLDAVDRVARAAGVRVGGGQMDGRHL